MFTNFKLRRLERKTYVVNNGNGTKTKLYIKKRNGGIAGYVYDIRKAVIDSIGNVVNDKPVERGLKPNPERIKARFLSCIDEL